MITADETAIAEDIAERSGYEGGLWEREYWLDEKTAKNCFSDIRIIKGEACTLK